VCFIHMLGQLLPGVACTKLFATLQHGAHVVTILDVVRQGQLRRGEVEEKGERKESREGLGKALSEESQKELDKTLSEEDLQRQLLARWAEARSCAAKTGASLAHP